MEVDLDCGSNSCHFAKSKGGMRTNSGCTCLSNAGFHRSSVMAAYEMLPEIIKLRAENEQLKEEIRALTDSADGVWDDSYNSKC